MMMEPGISWNHICLLILTLSSVMAYAQIAVKKSAQKLGLLNKDKKPA